MKCLIIVPSIAFYRRDFLVMAAYTSMLTLVVNGSRSCMKAKMNNTFVHSTLPLKLPKSQDFRGQCSGLLIIFHSWGIELPPLIIPYKKSASHLAVSFDFNF